MLDPYVRPIYQYFIVNPVAGYAKKFPPHFITLLACISGVAVIPALLFHLPAIAFLLLILSGFLDTLDGTVARLENKTSMAGAILDIISDRIVELAIIFALFAVDPTHRALLCLLMLGSCYLCVTGFLVVGIFKTEENDKKGFYYNAGLIERAEAFIFFALMIMFPGHFSSLAKIFSVLVLLTAYLHLRDAMKLTSTQLR